MTNSAEGSTEQNSDARSSAVCKSGERFKFLKPMLGCVWVKFVSPGDFPLGRVPCSLVSGDREWAAQETSDTGEVFWDKVPLDECQVKLILGSRHLTVEVPWLREKDIIHYERVINARQLLGPASSPHGTQVRLLGLGFNCGSIDGTIGPKTKDALRQFGRAEKLDEDGTTDKDLQGLLRYLYGA